MYALQKTKKEVTSQFIRKHARQALRFRQRVCANCGYTAHVEACHVKAVSSFDDNTLISEINAPENLVFLCPNCHKLFDSNLLEFKEEWTNLFVEEEDYDVL